MEQIKAMLEAMEKDAEFREEMMALMKSGNTDEIISAAAKKGFNFTEADWRAYIDMRKKQGAKLAGAELSPDDLGQVVGGGPTQNRYNQNDCMKIIAPCERCTGNGVFGMWCDHYRRDSSRTGQYEALVHHICVMGRYDMVVPEENNSRD